MEERYTKVVRFIILFIVLSVAVIGWHIYEFLHGRQSYAEESAKDHEIHELTMRLYEDELADNPFLSKVNLQGQTRAYERHDRAHGPLLKLNPADENISATIVLMRRLYDNYKLDTHDTEMVGAEEQQEELDFLNAIMQTKIMKRTMAYLHYKGAVGADRQSQLQLLKDIWFTRYSRGGGVVGSSGFEHVFLAEIKQPVVLGMHNWVYFAEQEAAGNVDYMGFIERKDLGKGPHFLLAIRFTFHKHVKAYNTLFVGTSPELEMSLYTVCFMLSSDKPCPVQLGHAKFNIITHSWDWKGKRTLATAFPSIEK